MKSSAVRKDESSPHLEENGEPIMSDPVETRIARIESDVEHIAANTADLRVELRRTNDKIDNGLQGLNKKIDDGLQGLNKKIDDGLQGLNKKIDDGHKELSNKIDGNYKDLNNKIDSNYKDLSNKIDGSHKELMARDDGLKDKLHSLSLWALLLYFTLAGGLLTVIARAFKWL
jgi:peptidoglycan hydrolase CwlO-like protein